MSTPEGDVSAIQAGTMEPLPRYIEHQDPPTDLQIIVSLVSAAQVMASPNLMSPGLLREIIEAETRGSVQDIGSPMDPDMIREIIETETRGSAQAIGSPMDPDMLREIIEAETRGVAQPSTEFVRRKIGYVVEVMRVGPSADDINRVREGIVKAYFDGISKEREDIVNLFIHNHLVTADTTSEGKTPLLAAVATRNMRIVKQLLDFGAEPDAYGILSKTWNWETSSNSLVQRTPLQLAASIGHLPMVKLFMEVYHCDDSRIAPDGQIALRLAVRNGHREVVDYLPSRRGGEFLRWKIHHETAIRRTKKALKKIYHFVKFFVWDIEYFFLWTIPEEFLVKPIIESCSWCWKNRKGFGPWCKSQVQQTPIRMKKFGNWVLKGLKKIPKAAKKVWKFTTEELPKIIKKMAKWVWTLFTKRIPNAIALVAKWIWGGVTAVAKSTWNVIAKFFSLLHTMFAAIFSFFRALTLKDVWDGFCELLRSIFVTFPKALGSWIYSFGKMSYKVMKAVFGTLGQCVWWICCGILFLIVYIPKRLWEVLQSMGSSVAKAWYELMVWINPKA